MPSSLPGYIIGVGMPFQSSYSLTCVLIIRSVNRSYGWIIKNSSLLLTPVHMGGGLPTGGLHPVGSAYRGGVCIQGSLPSGGSAS